MIQLLVYSLLAPSVLAAEPEPFRLPPPTTSQFVEFSSDHFEYDRTSSTLHLIGHARLHNATMTMRADEMWMDLETRRTRAEGHVEIEQGPGILFSDRGEYDFESEEGAFWKTVGGFPPWRIYGAKMRVDSRRTLYYRRARFTSCGMGLLREDARRLPHYHMRASWTRVRPDHSLWAFNVFFFLRRLPIFYTPVLYKSLAKEHLLRTRLTPGYAHRDGGFAKTTTIFNPIHNLQNEVFVDHYGHLGIGVGNQLQFKASEIDRGTLYAYRIKEKYPSPDPGKPPAERWVLLGDQYQTLVGPYAMQLRLQAQSDPDFNNHYTRSNAFRVTQQMVNNGALVRNGTWGITRLSYSRTDDMDLITRKYRKTSESSPRLEFNSAPVAIPKVNLLNTFSLSGSNDYNPSDTLFHRNGSAGWQMTQNYMLRGVSFVPLIGITETYIDNAVLADRFGRSRRYVDAFVGRYNLGGTARVNNPLGATDFTHAYVRRFVPDTLIPDVYAADKGVERNMSTLAHAFRPTRALFLRTETGYDFRTYWDRSVGFRDRVQPLIADFNFIPNRKFNVSVRDSYSLNKGNENFLLQADFGDRTGSFFGVGVFHSLGDVQHYILSQEIGWPSTGTWHVLGALRSDLYNTGGPKFSRWYFFEKEIILKYNFHDFNTRFVFRLRPNDVREVQFMLTLRLEATDVWRRQISTDYVGER